MRRTVFFVATWLAAGAGAVALAGVGVSAVGNQVTGSRPSPLSASEIRRELTADDSTSATTSVDAPTTSVTTEPITTTSVEASNVPHPTTTTSSTVGPAAVSRTYALEGGTVTLRFSPAGVTYEAPIPQPGFSVSFEEEDGTGIQVEFRSETHRSRVTGWWENGPRDEVREEDTTDVHDGT